MTKERLIILANHLDAKGLAKEADYLDSIIIKANNNPDPLETDEEDYKAGMLAALRNIQYFVGGLDDEINTVSYTHLRAHET